MMKQQFEIIRKGSGKELSKNFNSDEFDCKCDNCLVTMVEYLHISRLQELRDKLGEPIKITSGYRCIEHNIEVGGSKRSRHVIGDATDIKVKGLDPYYIAKAAEEIGFDGIGIYGRFTHLDSRGKKARWDNRAEK